MSVVLWIYSILAIGLGIYSMYEDFKSHEVSTFPMIILSVIGLPLSIAFNTKHLIPVIGAYLFIMLVFVILKPWGSGDTKMLSIGFLLSAIWLRPTGIMPTVLLYSAYLLILSILGLITVLIMKSKKVPMGHCFLITNISAIIFSIVLGGV